MPMTDGKAVKSGQNANINHPKVDEKWHPPEIPNL
jgi:hypothetical protein